MLSRRRSPEVAASEGLGTAGLWHDRYSELRLPVSPVSHIQESLPFRSVLDFFLGPHVLVIGGGVSDSRRGTVE
jgi:hypothetical protein